MTDDDHGVVAIEEILSRTRFSAPEKGSIRRGAAKASPLDALADAPPQDPGERAQ